jgi:glycosyltransferase involved in cell wall biosynthesis
MPLLSVITAGYAPKGDYLADTVESLLAQELPAGWDFEWVFQEDGSSPSLAGLAGRVPQVRYQANHEPLGIAATRNLALSRARGDLVRVLDHDDVLLPGGLGRPIPLFATSWCPWWVLSKADEIDFGGVRRNCPPPRWIGEVPAGRLGPVTDAVGRWSVYSAGMTARTDIVRALGGWLGVPRAEDVGLLTALAEIRAGYVDAEVSWLYRRHPGQTHLGANWQAREMQAVRLVTQRLEGIRSAGMAPADDLAAAADTRAVM